jgi:alkyl hydroperoxide reductase subunit AhpC
MPVRIGDEAPDFTAETTEGTIRFHEWKKYPQGFETHKPYLRTVAQPR